jgi:hypothetical protein
MSSEQDTIVRQAMEHLICSTEGFIRIDTNADAENLFLSINKALFKDSSKYKRKGFENRLGRVKEIHSLMEKGIFLLFTASNHE